MEDKITKSVIVKADIKDVYNAWSNFENFPLFMKNIKSVEKIDHKTSHWVMQGPMGVNVEWEAETTAMDEDKRVGWSTKDNQEGNLTTSGQVTFNPLPHNETEVVATVHYKVRAGVPGEVVGRMFGDPEGRLEEDLMNFKNYIEGRIDRTNFPERS
ncbi:MAG TPA: SRPBCC family protein [Anaerolineales bacterium]|nr:SRPBCC family protein [Anaerolineales bacterium]